MKGWFSLIIIISLQLLNVQWVEGQSSPDCEKEHLKYVYKEFRVFGDFVTVKDWCEERQDLLLARMKTSEDRQKIYEFISLNNHQYYLDQLETIYQEIDLDCVAKKDSFDFLFRINIEGCEEGHISDKQFEDFKKQYKIDTDLILDMTTSPPIICGSSGYSVSNLQKGYDGLAPFPIHHKVRIEVPKQ